MKTLLLLLCLLITVLSHAQVCSQQYSAIEYKGISFDTVGKAIVTVNDEMAIVGKVRGFEGWAAKFSAKGSVLWSNEYKVRYGNNRVFYSEMEFTDIIQTTDNGFMITGNTLRTYYSGDKLLGNVVGLLMKVDRYGNVEWCKQHLSIGGGALNITNIFRLKNNDLILYMASDKGIDQFSYSKIIRIHPDGSIVWINNINTQQFDTGFRGFGIKRAMTEKENGELIFGDIALKRDRSTPASDYSETDLHFYALNSLNGKLLWETSYEYPRVNPTYIPNINDVQILANGSLRFMTTLALPGSSPSIPYPTAVAIFTDQTGHIDSINSYQLNGNGLALRNVTGNTALFSTNGKGILAKLNGIGRPQWSKSYDNNNGKFTPNVFASGTNKFAIWQSNYKTYFTELLLTHSQGEIDCRSADVTISVSSASMEYRKYNITTDTVTIYRDPFEITNLDMVVEPYVLSKATTCEEVTICCKDVVDSVNITSVRLCEGQSYRLPDNQVVTKGGNYYVTRKTSLGCDSISYYKIAVDKSVSSLSAGLDTCLVDAPSISLRATPGFERYNWMGNIADSNYYSVYRKGTYWVKVSNACGTKTDSVTVYDQCEFPIFMPTAFTPNNDHLNDEFGVDNQNQNHLISLKIYNRWGQIIFISTSKSKRWNGKIKDAFADSGLYIYTLEMKSLSGKKISSSGQVMLIR